MLRHDSRDWGALLKEFLAIIVFPEFPGPAENRIQAKSSEEERLSQKLEAGGKRGRSLVTEGFAGGFQPIGCAVAFTL